MLQESYDTVANCYAMQGGAVSYAAAVATAFGVRSCIVTAASSDANLTVFEGHELHIVSTQETLTFEHTYTWWGEISSSDPIHHPQRKHSNLSSQGCRAASAWLTPSLHAAKCTCQTSLGLLYPRAVIATSFMNVNCYTCIGSAQLGLCSKPMHASNPHH